MEKYEFHPNLPRGTGKPGQDYPQVIACALKDERTGKSLLEGSVVLDGPLPIIDETADREN